MTEQRGPAVGDERTDVQLAEALDLPLVVVAAARQRLARIVSAPAPLAARRETLARLIGDEELAARVSALSKLEAMAPLSAAIGLEALPRLIDRIVGHSDGDFEQAAAALEKARHFIDAGQLPDLKVDLDREIGSLTLAELQHVASTLGGRTGSANIIAAAPVAVVIVAALVSGSKLAKDYKDAIDDKRTKDHKDGKDGKDGKDEPDRKHDKDSKDQVDHKSDKDLKDSKETKDNKDAAETSLKSSGDAGFFKAHTLEKVEREGKPAGEHAAGAAPGVTPDTTIRELLARLAGGK